MQQDAVSGEGQHQLSDLLLPDGLTLADVQAGAALVRQWQDGDGEFADAWNAHPLVIRLFELLTARSGVRPGSA